MAARLTAAGVIQIAAAYAPNFAVGDGGPALVAGLNAPNGVQLAPDGSLLIVDTFNDRIRRISRSGTITTVAGDGVQVYTNSGPATSVALPTPQAVAADLSGNLYMSDGAIFIISPSGIVSVFYPTSFLAIAIDPQGNLLVPYQDLNEIVRITPTGVATVIVGTGTAGFFGDDGPATSAELNGPQGIAADASGNVYISDSGNNRVGKSRRTASSPRPPEAARTRLMVSQGLSRQFTPML
jgi:streptogramin lyase